MKSYYEILGVSENASQEEIKKRYRSIALEMHPDRLINRSKEDVDKIQKNFQEITNAYQTLSDEKERRKYDNQRKNQNFFDNDSGFDGFNNSGWGFEDILDNFFGSGGRSRSWNRSSEYSESSSSKAENLNVSLTISFEDLVNGSTKKFNLKLLRSCSSCSQTGAFSNQYLKTCSRCNGEGFVESIRKTFLGAVRTHSKCSSCQGSGKIITKKCENCKGSKIIQFLETIEIKIPRGIKPGQRITIKSKGNDELGKSRGDIVIEIKLKEHNFFQKKENDIHCSIPISFLDAILGNKIKVVTIEGIQEIKIPACSQVGDCFILKNKGFYTNINGDRRGDLYVWFQIKLPRKIGSRTEELMKEINEYSSWNPNEEFIKKIKE